MIAEDELISPLRFIETAAQYKAKEERLDLTNAVASEQLKSIIHEQIDQWSDDYRRGQRLIEITAPDELAQRAFNNIARFGPLTDLLTEKDVWEIMINGPSAIFVKRHSGDSGYHHEVFHDNEHLRRTITKMLDESTTSHRKLDPAEGLQDAQLDDGSRVHIVHSDIARDGNMLVNIRKFTGVSFKRLDQLVQRDMLSIQAANLLKALVQAKTSILFSGVPGSGKTTLLSCCAAELDPQLRVAIAEEVFETDIPLPNVAHMQTRPTRGDRGAIDLRRLVSGFLRMAPDVAIVGEVRDREALPLLLTLSSGVKGFTTIHAGSARQALTRLRFICQLAETSNELPISALNTLVSESIDIVVHCDRIDGIPRVQEIIAVEDMQSGASSNTFTTTPLFVRSTSTSSLEWTGSFPVRIAEMLERRGIALSTAFPRERSNSK